MLIRISYLFILYSIFFLFSCKKEETKIYEPYEGPLAEIHNVESLFSDSAIVRIKMNTPLQYELQNGNREFPEGIVIDFFNEKGVVESNLVSNYAIYDAEKKIYNVKGNVIIENKKKGEKLNSEELYWNPSTKEIYAPEDVQVRVETKTELLIGKGLTAKQDFSEYKILNPTGTFSIEK